ncbi:uncharacterized protein J8A68_001167 [[Candida] subhashii]|uniref:CENP-T/Histone H4 histone fold domain-containing protein n=1 Tax=[Candida] subhashii TaxID=561895 RepID=A0A8J5V4X4_9ASCO|nr:uncharacterized protein J8A68_001167 [[Candida] subhashii]KAG7665479.1 hypothetical protein J8A68_001167 [[Candida] subhashii]
MNEDDKEISRSSISTPTTPLRRSSISGDNDQHQLITTNSEPRFRSFEFLRSRLRLPPPRFPESIKRNSRRQSSSSRPQSRSRSRPTTPKVTSPMRSPNRRRSNSSRRVSVTPTRIRSEKKRRRSSIAFTEKGEKLYGPEYQGPITIDFLKFYCKVIKENKKQRLQQTQPQQEILEPSVGYISQTPTSTKVDNITIGSTQFEGISRTTIQDPFLDTTSTIEKSRQLALSDNLTIKTVTSPSQEFNDSLPIPSDTENLLKSPQTLPPVIQARTPDKSEPTMKPPPKALSYLQKILANKAKQVPNQDTNVTKEKTILPSERSLGEFDKSLEAARKLSMGNISSVQSDLETTTDISEKYPRFAVSDFEIDLPSDMGEFEPTTDVQSVTRLDMGDFEPTTDAQSVTRLDMGDFEPTTDAQSETRLDMGIETDIGSDREVFATPGPATTDIDDITGLEQWMKPTEVDLNEPVQGENSTLGFTDLRIDERDDLQTPKLYLIHDLLYVSLLSLLITGQERGHDEREQVRDNYFEDQLFMPSATPSPRQFITDGDSFGKELSFLESNLPLRSRRSTSNLPRIRNNQPNLRLTRARPTRNVDFGYKPVNDLVKTIRAHQFSSNPKQKQWKPSITVDSSYVKFIQSKADDFLTSMMTDLDAYARHRVGSSRNPEIGIEDVMLYLRRIKFAEKDDSKEMEIDKVMKFAHDFWPLESLIQLDNSLRDKLLKPSRGDE